MKRFSNIIKANAAAYKTPPQAPPQAPPQETPVVVEEVVAQVSAKRKITKEEMIANMPKKLLKPAK
jgi:hypothetical protein